MERGLKRRINLPRRLDGKGLIELLELLSSYKNVCSIELNLEGLKRVTPAGLVLLTAWITKRADKGYSTEFVNIEECEIKGYLQRMDLLSACGERGIEENFLRHDSAKRFVEIREIEHDTDKLAEETADVIAPGGDDYDHENAGLWDAAKYLITELANNVRQHGKGKGFIAAQATKGDGFVRIAVCDSGMGIRKSLMDGRTDLSDEMSDGECILKSLGARVSSKGQPYNEGVGLTLTSQVTSLMEGRVLICSGEGVVITGKDGEAKEVKTLTGTGIDGTLVTLIFRQSLAQEGFNERLHEAKELKDLLQNTENSIKFKL